MENFNSNKLFKNLLVSCPNQDGGMYLFNNNGEFKKICNYLTIGFDISKNYFLRSFQAEESILYFNNLNIDKETHFTTIDPHDVKIIDNLIYQVETKTNSINIFDLNFNILKKISFPGESDSMHLNCVNKINSNIYFSCFGDFKKEKEYNKFKNKSKGYISNLNTKEKVIKKLNQPHSILQHENEIYVCNSGDSTIKIFNKNFKIIKTIKLRGYLRGLEITDKIIYVGSSASRNNENTINNNFAEIFALDKGTHKKLSSITIPSNEIYDIKFFKDNKVLNLIQKSSYYFTDLVNQKKIKKLNSSLTQRTEETEQQSKTIETLNQTLTTKDQEIHNLHSSLTQRMEEIKKIMSSNSYKYTAPLRKLRRIAINTINRLKILYQQIRLFF